MENEQNINRSQAITNELPFITKIRQSVFVAKRKVLEGLGEEPIIDRELQTYIDKLTNTANDYTTMHKLVLDVYNDYKNFTETQRLLGNHLYEIGVKEEEAIRNTLQDIGTVHRNLEKDSVQLLRCLGTLMDTIRTFRGAAVEDTLTNLERYTDARHEYEGTMILITDLQEQSKPPEDEIAHAKQLSENYKQSVDKYSDDLRTKVSILDEKRVQVITAQLQAYTETLYQYYISCNDQLNELVTTTQEDTTEDFHQLLTSNFKLNT